MGSIAKSIWDIPFVVCDVETTGSNPIANSITEISCVTTIAGEINSEFSSLVNPHQTIPHYIVQMTGITDQMAFLAPEAAEIMPQVKSILSQPDAVFVAHNVAFDWSFVYNSMIKTNIEAIEIPKLCTLKLARRLLPQNKKANVGALAKYFNIAINNRHRAYADAIATAKILNELLLIAESEHNINNIEELLKFQNVATKQFKIPAKNYKQFADSLKDLPSEPGVYYFHDKKGSIIYVGKAKSLKERVNSYFTGISSSQKITKLLKNVFKISWECTDTELSALLLESKEIKRIKPKFNTLDKAYKSYSFIKIPKNSNYPILEITDRIEPDGAEYFGPFNSEYFAQEIIYIINKRFQLRKCSKINVRTNSEKKQCVYYDLKMCLSPCSKEVKQSYSDELDKVRSFLCSFNNGIIELYEKKMQEYSEKLEFEKADSIKNQLFQLKKLFSRQQKVPTSINQNNFILIIPSSEQYKTVEIFFIRFGKLVHQATFGRKAPVEQLFSIIKNSFFNGTAFESNYTKEDIEELKIILSWTYRQQNYGNFIYLSDKSEEQIQKELLSVLRNISFEQNEQEEFFNQCYV